MIPRGDTRLPVSEASSCTHRASTSTSTTTALSSRARFFAASVATAASSCHYPPAAAAAAGAPPEPACLGPPPPLCHVLGSALALYAMMPVSSAPATGSRRWHHRNARQRSQRSLALVAPTTDQTGPDLSRAVELVPHGPGGHARRRQAPQVHPRSTRVHRKPPDARPGRSQRPLALVAPTTDQIGPGLSWAELVPLGQLGPGGQAPQARRQQVARVHPRPRVHREPPCARPRSPLPLRSHWQARCRPRFPQSQQPAPPASRWLPGDAEPRVEVPHGRRVEFWRGAGRLLFPVRLAERAAQSSMLSRLLFPVRLAERATQSSMLSRVSSRSDSRVSHIEYKSHRARERWTVRALRGRRGVRSAPDDASATHRLSSVGPSGKPGQLRTLAAATMAAHANER